MVWAQLGCHSPAALASSTVPATGTATSSSETVEVV